MQALNISSVYVLLDIIAVFMLLFFAVFLFSHKREPPIRQYLLASFFLVLALSYMDGVFISLNYRFHVSYPHIVHFSMSFDFLVGPVLLLFILSMTRSNFKPRKQHLIQCLPFVLHILFLIGAHVRHNGNPTDPIFSRQDIILLTSTSSLHLLGYMVAVLIELLRYRKRLRANLANHSRHNLHWLMLISTGLLIAGLARFLNNLAWLIAPRTAYEAMIDLKVVAIIGVFVFACTVVFKSLRQPVFIDYADESKRKSKLPDLTTRQQLLRNITSYMQNHKPYLNTDFDLAGLANAIDIPAYRVSQVINHELQQNFFDFVNGYRIEACCQRLTSSNQTITEVMFAAGFNSKSVFNTAFKKQTGQTPSQYRKNPRVENAIQSE